jgi:hypothetical protein
MFPQAFNVDIHFTSGSALFQTNKETSDSETVPLPLFKLCVGSTVDPKPFLVLSSSKLNDIIANLDASTLDTGPDILNLGSDVNGHSKAVLEFGIVQEDKITLSMVIIELTIKCLGVGISSG